MNCIFWNCRGAASKEFISSLVDLIHLHKPLFISLLEKKTHSSAASRLLQKTHLNKMVASKAWGFSGGIWLLWDDT